MKRISRILGWPVLLLSVAALIGIIGLIAVRDPAPVLADQAKFYLDCPTTEVREGESIDVFLVRVTNHQHSVTFGAHWFTDAGTAGTSDYVHQDTGGWVWGNETDRLANRLTRTFETSEDNLVEGNETFTARFGPIDNVVDRDNPDRDETCEITIIDDDPNITDVEVTSSPARDNTYGVGETIEISATFSTEVDVDGSPALGLQVGDNWRSAGYLRGSGSDTLVFGYKVVAGDSDSNGIKMDGGYQDSDGRWRNFSNHTAVTAPDADGTGIVAYRAYAGIGDQSGHKVDGSLAPVGTSTRITSSPASGDTYRYGETIDFAITFSTELEVEGSRHLSLRVGPDDDAGWRGAAYKSGSGTDTLTFGYTVKTADLDTNGVMMLGTWLEGGRVYGLGGSGTVRVAGAGTVVSPAFSGLSHQSDHKVNGQPYPRNISITSTPVSRSDTYGLGEVIQVSVDFGQNVTAADSAYAILRIGSVSMQGHAAYSSGNGTDTLVFEYTVLEADRADNGVAAFVPDGLDIKATGTDVGYQPNPGGETPVMAEDSSHKVDGSLLPADTTPPTVSSVSFDLYPGPGDDSTYRPGDWLGVLVIFSEPVLVTGTPQLEINIGGAARQAQAGHLHMSRSEISEIDLGDGSQDAELISGGVAHATVIFGYTVQEGDSDSNGISIGANRLTLNGGTIKDVADNDAILTHDAVSDDSVHKVDGVGPTISSVAITSDPGDDDTYGNGDAVQVTVTFSEHVTVTGTPQLELDVGGTPKTASYSSANGATVVFIYTVAVGDVDSDGIAIDANKLTPSGGTITDAQGNGATLTHSAIGADDGHKVSAPGGL